MNPLKLTFTANEQTLTKTDNFTDFASNTVSYIEATFTLGENWTGYDSVRAVWKTDYYTISTVLDANFTCVVPTEVLRYKAKVFVNMVGSIVENDTLTDRLTTFPVLALTVKANAAVNGSETAPVTPSQFEQFVDTVQDAADSISDYSYDSEAWAVGTRGGVDVPSTDPTYHNNSKYWAEENAGLADDVAGLADDVADLKSDLDQFIDDFGGSVDDAVNYWLDAHPEATTTVEDGSLTEAKFSNALKLKTIKDYVTPEMFGAVGDGSTNDYQALFDAIEYSIDNEIPLYLSREYYMSTPIDLSAKGKVTLHIYGSYSERRYIKYPYENYAGSVSVIHCPNGFIENTEIYGTIDNVCFYSAENEMPFLFSNSQLHCTLKKIIMLNFTYAFYECTCNLVMIDSCLGLAINNFLYNCSFVDSTIAKSYINGGGSNPNGIFAHLYDCNGSTFVDNFIDFYRVMFSQSQNSVFLNIISTGNQYQGFRYFETLEPGAVLSTNDAFAYFDEAFSTQQGYNADITTDPITGDPVTIKPYIAYFGKRCFKRYKSALLLKRYDCVLFVLDYALYEFAGTCAEFDYVCGEYTNPTEQIISAWYYTGTAATGNSYKPNAYKCDIIREVLDVTDAWTGNRGPFVIGEYVRYQNNVYQVVPYFYDSGSGIRIGGYKFKQINTI